MCMFLFNLNQFSLNFKMNPICLDAKIQFQNNINDFYKYHDFQYMYDSLNNLLNSKYHAITGFYLQFMSFVKQWILLWNQNQTCSILHISQNVKVLIAYLVVMLFYLGQGWCIGIEHYFLNVHSFILPIFCRCHLYRMMANKIKLLCSSLAQFWIYSLKTYLSCMFKKIHYRIKTVFSRIFCEKFNNYKFNINPVSEISNWI